MAQFPRSAILRVAGSISLLVGAYLPWLRTNPSIDGPVPQVLIMGMESGIRGFDYLLLVIVGVVLLPSFLTQRKRLQAVSTLGGGVSSLLVCGHYVFGFDSLVGFNATFVPSVGWYLALLGGVLLTVNGALGVPTIIRGRRDTSTVQS